jgi:hypothetical protein
VGAGLFICCFLVFLVVPTILFVLIYIFRLSCVLCGLPKPTVLAAAGIISVNFVADAIALSILEHVVWSVAKAINVPRWESWLVTRFLDLPVDLAISAGLHAGLMGIKFGKGIEVWFVQRLIQLSIIAAIVFIGVIIYLVQGN